jgi:hypothetical protein
MSRLKIIAGVVVAGAAVIAPTALRAGEEPKYAVVQNNDVFEVPNTMPTSLQK